MLYVDQPVQVGFSYDTLVNGTYNLESNDVIPVPSGQDLPAQNVTLLAGTFASQNPQTTVNTTATAAKALWHFAENWLASFPEYKTKSNLLSVWGNSYGGYWAPATAAYFRKQLEKSSVDRLSKVTLDTLGITNGCIDQLYQMPGYPEFAYNNTYGVQFINESVYVDAMNNFTKAGGCRDQIVQCRQLGIEGDPGWTGSNDTVNQVCQGATAYCFEYVVGAFDELTGVSLSWKSH